MLSSTLTPDFGLETTSPLDEAFVFAACALMPCALIQASKNYHFIGAQRLWTVFDLVVSKYLFAYKINKLGFKVNEHNEEFKLYLCHSLNI